MMEEIMFWIDQAVVVVIMALAWGGMVGAMLFLAMVTFGGMVG